MQVIIPEALRRGVHNVALIMDNGTTHAPKQLERWLQAHRTSRDWPFTIHVYWLPPNASWLDQIEIWFSILVRRVIKRGNFTSTDDLRERILAFIEYFNKTMAKPFKWTFTGKPLAA